MASCARHAASANSPHHDTATATSDGVDTALSESDTGLRHRRHPGHRAIRLLRDSLKVPVNSYRQGTDGISRTLVPDQIGMTVALR